MTIRLSEIPAEGRSYEYDRESGELNEILSDLIEDHPYKVDLFIKPIGNAYEMRGEIKAGVTEICSTCGWDFEANLGRKVNEILFEEQEEHRKGHSVHGNRSVDFLGEGPSMTAYKGDVFNAADYVHEVIALAEPFYPTCGENGQCKRQDEVAEIRRKLDAEFALAEEQAKAVGNPAFSVLKNLDLRTKN